MKNLRGAGTPGGVPSWLAVVALSTLVACEETKEEAPPAPAPTSAIPAPPPLPVPAPEPEPEEKTPTKKLEDCEPGKVTFSSEDIEAHIRMKAQKPEGDITAADLSRITSVNFSRTPLDTLDPCMFSKMKSLKEVFLGPGKVWDISPLASLTNLESVRLAGNPVEDLTPLEKATKMDRLDISDTKISDLSVTENMTKLTEVTLDGSLVEDISPLAKAPDLETLSLKRTQVKKLDALKDNKKLEQVFIAESALASDIAATGVLAKNGVKIVSD